MRMRILYNGTSLFQGGAIKRSTDFIRYVTRHDDGHRWLFALSPAASEDCRHILDNDWPRVTIEQPSRSLSARARLKKTQSEFRPERVLTFCGPAYVSFNAPHLMGFADGFVSHASRLAYESYRLPFERLRMWTAVQYKKRWVGQADRWFIQTESARHGLSRRCRLPLERITVIPNTCGEQYAGDITNGTIRPVSGPTRIVTFSAPYKHKRLDLIPHVAAELRKLAPSFAFEFVLTVDPATSAWKQIESLAHGLNVADVVSTCGALRSDQGPRLFQSSHICFLPTLLETFSGTYPEAMAMRVPIVTTDLDFARDVCQDAARYFQANDAKSAAEAILDVALDKQLANTLIDNGSRVVAALPTTGEQVAAILRLLEEM